MLDQGLHRRKEIHGRLVVKESTAEGSCLALRSGAKTRRPPSPDAQPAGTSEPPREGSHLRSCLLLEDLHGVPIQLGRESPGEPKLILPLLWGQGYSSPWEDRRA